jgi:hypothetical protein
MGTERMGRHRFRSAPSLSPEAPTRPIPGGFWERSNVRDGSKGEILAASRCFPLWPNDGHRSIGSACLFGARLRHRRDHVLTLPSGAAADGVLRLDANHVITNTQLPTPSTPARRLRLGQSYRDAGLVAREDLRAAEVSRLNNVLVVTVQWPLI